MVSRVPNFKNHSTQYDPNLAETLILHLKEGLTLQEEPKSFGRQHR